MADEVKVSKFGNTLKNFIKFFKEVRSELKKVIWPSRTQLTNNTVTVIACCIIVGAIIWAADLGLTTLIEKFLTGK